MFSALFTNARCSIYNLAINSSLLYWLSPDLHSLGHSFAIISFDYQFQHQSGESLRLLKMLYRDGGRKVLVRLSHFKKRAQMSS